MKKRFVIIISFITLVLFYSCDKWLYLEPEDGVIREDFWKSKEDVYAALNGCYASMLGKTSGKGAVMPELLFLWGEIRADMLAPDRYNSAYQYIFNGDILPENDICRWNSFYRTINYCNTVLAFSEDVQKTDPAFSFKELKQYQSEALTLRALMFFYLVRSFDQVPLKLTATKSDDENFVLPKSSRNVILKQIKTDLLEAEKNAVYTYGDIDTDKGRITKYTINALQADVYLWAEQYDSCIIACDKIINSRQFGLISSVSPELWFNMLYVEGNSRESIFELQFSGAILNPFYTMLRSNRYFKASASIIDEIFPLDANSSPDSADIRSDGCSYRATDNYSIWKYLGFSRSTIRTSSQSYAHFIIYRYAEILLFKAEALTQLNRGEEAIKYIDAVRKRARASITSSIGEGVTDKASLTTYILEERSREFAFEGKRWYDVLRNAKRNKYQNLQIMLNMVLRSAPADKQQTIISKYKDTLSHYWPIHTAELDANPELKQNDFYAD